MLIKIRFTFTGFYLIYASKHHDKLFKIHFNTSYRQAYKCISGGERHLKLETGKLAYAREGLISSSLQ